MNILQNLWPDTAGRIFLVTFASYLFGYMVYGGYIYTFFGRKGSLPFGLADFSITDLISIFPTAIITLINFFPKAAKEITKGFFIHLFLPAAFGIGIMIIIDHARFRLSQLLLDPTLIRNLAFAGFVLWSIGYLLAIFHPIKNPKVSFVTTVLLRYIGASLFFLPILNLSVPIPVTPAPLSQTQLALNNILNSLMEIFLIIDTILIAYAFGVGIALTAIKSNQLIKIDRLTLRQPILKTGIKKITVPPEIKERIPILDLWLSQKNLPIDIKPDVYEWSPTPDITPYLIATFEKFVLIFISGLVPENNSTIVISRDVIMSIEIAHKTEPKTH